MNQVTLKMVTELSQSPTTARITKAWLEVLNEIGATASDHEVVASVIVAQIRSGQASIEVVD